MICPKCHADYFENIKKCGDCNLNLVDACSLDIPIPDMTWISLSPIYGNTNAEMIIDILNTEDIPHYTKYNWSSSALGTGGNSLVDNIVRIFIPEFYQEKTMKILKGVHE